ncbi:pyridoxamine 5'-phosphate oxidase family protein [Thalassobellus citreus]|uniref:pyridoxamine 5'-phosphate oxidase family protein n=1 Tax=Thalassobellus citreus TaxID=3367752 RepID=UPI003798108C
MKEYKISELNKVKRGANRATYDVEKINNILDAGFVGYVSYVFNNKAITIPMAYGRIENKIYLHGSRKNRMLLALLENKEASMTVMHLDGLVLARSGFHHSVNYRSVTIFGSVVQVDNPTLKEKALKQVVDQMIPGRWESLRPMNDKEFNGTLVVEMIIETASAKIRDVGAKDEKADLDFPVWAGIIPIKQIAEPPIPDSLLADAIETPKHVLDYYEQHKL